MPTADLILVLGHKVKITLQLDLILVVLMNHKCELMKVTTYCVRELNLKQARLAADGFFLTSAILDLSISVKDSQDKFL